MVADGVHDRVDERRGIQRRHALRDQRVETVLAEALASLAAGVDHAVRVQQDRVTRLEGDRRVVGHPVVHDADRRSAMLDSLERPAGSQEETHPMWMRIWLRSLFDVRNLSDRGGVIVDVADLPPAEQPMMPRLPVWRSGIFIVLGAALVPWTLWLAVTLPARHVAGHYDAAWSGFDIALAASLVATGIGLLRRSLWTQGAAVAAATLLVCDAWFDVLLATPGSERVASIALALMVELPVAAACIAAARRAEQAAASAERFAQRVEPQTRRGLPRRSPGAPGHTSGARSCPGRCPHRSGSQ